MALAIFLTLFLVNSACINLYLPNNEKESPDLLIDRDTEYINSVFHPATLIHCTITYESKTKDLISKVFYHGVEIFNDEGSSHKPDRRIVTYTLMGRKIIISIHPEEIDKSVESNYFEAQYFIDHECLYDMAHNFPVDIHIVNNNKYAVKESELLGFLARKELEYDLFPLFPSLNIGEFLSSIFSRKGRLKNREAARENFTPATFPLQYDEDYQLRGNVDEREDPDSEQELDHDHEIGSKSGVEQPLVEPAKTSDSSTFTVFGEQNRKFL